MILIDKLSYSSKLRFKSPNLKALFSILTLLICVISKSIFISLIILFTNSFLITYVNKTPVKYYIRLMNIPLIFLILSTLAIIINYSSVPLSSIAIPLFNHYLTISIDSLTKGASLILTALASVSCLYFLTITTTMTDILIVLQNLHCPSLIIELMLLIYRFIFILMDLASSLTIAQKSRLGNKDFKTSCYSVGSLMAVLLVRAFQKSSFLYDSMESRCYNGTINVLNETHKGSSKELYSILLFDILLTILSLYIYLKR